MVHAVAEWIQQIAFRGRMHAANRARGMGGGGGGGWSGVEWQADANPVGVRAAGAGSD